MKDEFDAAEGLFRTITERYPEEREAWVGLGEVLYHGNPARGRRAGESRKPLQRALELDPTRYYEPLMHLINLALMENRELEVDSAVLELAGETAEFRFLLPIVRATVAQDSRLLAAALDTLRAHADDPRVVLAVLHEAASAPHADLAQMVAVVRAIAETATAPELAALAWGRVARLEAGRGRLRAAGEAWNRAVAIFPGTAVTRATFYAGRLLIPFPARQLDGARNALLPVNGTPMERATQHFFAGLLCHSVGDPAAALPHLAEIDRLRLHPDVDTIRVRTFHHVLRSLDYGASRPAEALREFTRARHNFRDAPARVRMAELLALNGDWRGAQRWLGAASDGVGQPDPAYIHFRLAQISEEIGDHAQAVKSYTLFVLPMDSADAEVAVMVQFARQRLDALTRSRR